MGARPRNVRRRLYLSYGMILSYPAGGWLPPGAHFELKWDDQGRDFATNWNGVLQAPGSWRCLEILSDQAFPNGFGPHYAVIEVLDGPWSSRANPASDNSGVFYLGHDTTLVGAGQSGRFGDALAHANQGQDWAGTQGGWVELGNAYRQNGMWLPGPKRSSHWFDALISKPLDVTVPDPPIKWGDSGWRVIGLTNMLKTMGYLDRLYRTYDKPEIHGAIVAFKEKHHIPMPAAPDPRRGWVDQQTDAAMRAVRDFDRKNHRKDYP